MAKTLIRHRRKLRRHKTKKRYLRKTGKRHSKKVGKRHSRKKYGGFPPHPPRQSRLVYTK